MRKTKKFWLATISEANGVILKRRHLVRDGETKERAVLCGAMKKGQGGRKVHWQDWQRLPMTVAELAHRARKRDDAQICAACKKLGLSEEEPPPEKKIGKMPPQGKENEGGEGGK